MPKTQQRRLAAIMFTDIVGYTAMMQYDEPGTMEKVDRYKQVHQEYVSRYKGQILKLYGDGSLTLFDSVLNAVNCAAEIQKELQTTPEVPIRIGLHVGEVIFTEDDIYGDGINIASRIQALGVEGSVLFSKDIHDKIKNQLEFPGTLLGKFKLKNVTEEMEVFALASPGIRVPTRSEMIKLGILDSWSKKQMKKARALWYLKAVRYGVIILAMLILAALVNLRVQYSKQKKKLLTESIPQLKEKVNSIEMQSDPRIFDYFLNAIELDEKVTDNDDMIEILNKTSTTLSIFTTPPEADLFIKPYQRPDTAWYFMGKTPLSNIRFPYGVFRVIFEKEGYNLKEDVIRPRRNRKGDSLYFKLFTAQEIPGDMVFAEGHGVGGYRYMFPGGTNLRPAVIGDFFVDRNEVTNADYQTFVDAGGYKNPAYWKETFVKNGDTLSWEAGIELFRDESGWAGPAGWQMGEFIHGRDDFPVSGVSWYEAAAYAEFVEKNLPTIYHYIILGGATPEMLTYGNFNGVYAVPVHSTDNLLWNGTYNLKGNVCEWIYNANEDLSRHWTVGGNYKEPDYQHLFPQSYDSWTRSDIIGFRCIRYIDDTMKSTMETPFFGISKGYIEEEIVSDEVFEVFKQRWDYEKRPLHPVVLEEIRSDTYIKQLVQFDVPYEDLPLKLIIWIPLKAKPPYQIVVSWRGIGSRNMRDLRFDEMEPDPYTEEYYLKSGRVVILPIYYSTFDRGLKAGDPMFKWEVHDTYSVIDAQLTCDYIYQNDSLDNDRIAFNGFSWGALRTPFVLAMEKRYKVAIAILAGLKYYIGEEPWHYMLHYLPRVNTPMLLIGGRYDAEYPPESQEAFIKYLGTPDEDIRHVILNTGHTFPGSEAINESLAFLDKYFGPVEVK